MHSAVIKKTNRHRRKSLVIESNLSLWLTDHWKINNTYLPGIPSLIVKADLNPKSILESVSSQISDSFFKR